MQNQYATTVFPNGCVAKVRLGNGYRYSASLIYDAGYSNLLDDWKSDHPYTNLDCCGSDELLEFLQFINNYCKWDQ